MIFIFPLILRFLHKVTLEIHNASQSSNISSNINIVSGRKLCPMCRNKLCVGDQSETETLLFLQFKKKLLEL